jgi:hypothetical protein
MEPTIFSTIPLLPSIPNIYRALGYSKGRTALKVSIEKEVNQYIEEARGYITLKGAALRLSIKKIDEKYVTLENNVVFESRDLAKFLKGSKEIFLLGSTAGKEIMKLISQKTLASDMTRAVVYSAVAGEMADDVLTWMMDYFRSSLIREGLVLDSKRFSSGYGDFSIQNQRVFWDLLKLRDIGVAITQDCFLIPEKSVTAVCAVRSEGSMNER